MRLDRTLGPQVVAWMEANLVHGPGDVQGERLELDDEQVRFLLRCYEIDDHGRRVVRRAVYMRPKGRAKTELAAAVACAEALGPVRFAGWGEDGKPVGRPVVSPYVRLAATEEGQAGNTYEAVRVMLTEGPLSRAGLDVGLTRTYLPGGGKILPVTAAAASKEGGKESFAVFDETGLYVLPELHRMYETIRRNLAKRKQAEPWCSRRRRCMRSARNPSPSTATRTARRSRRAASLIPASCSTTGRRRTDSTSTTRRAARRARLRVRRRRLMDGLGPAGRGGVRLARGRVPPVLPESAGGTVDAMVVAGRMGCVRRPRLPGSRGHESRARLRRLLSARLVRADRGNGRGTPVPLGRRTLGAPAKAPEDWTVDREHVDAVVHKAMETYDVVELAFDPPGWLAESERWADSFGDVVVAFPTASRSRMAAACSRFYSAVMGDQVAHDGDARLARHLANAVLRETAEGGYIIKDGKNSPEEDRRCDRRRGRA